MEIRCPNCGKKLGDRVLGLYQTQCPRCHNAVRVVMRGAETITFGGKRYAVSCREEDETSLLRASGVYSPAQGVDT